MKISRSAEVIPFLDTKRNFTIIKAVKEAVELKMSYLLKALSSMRVMHFLKRCGAKIKRKFCGDSSML